MSACSSCINHDEEIITPSDSNLSVLMSLDGEPGWVCLMSCNCDSECCSRNQGVHMEHSRNDLADIDFKFCSRLLSYNW